MRVVINVTGHAGRVGILICSSFVTRFTIGIRVCADQRKAGDVMIKPQLSGPSCGDVAAFALGPQLALVRIIIYMAGSTIRR